MNARPDRFTRAEVCALAAMDPARFQAIARRGLLVQVTDYELGGGPAAMAEVEDRQGWRRYDITQALGLVLLDDLTRADGLPLPAAAKAIGNSLGYVLGDPARKLDPDAAPADEIWIGLARWNVDGHGHAEDKLGASHFGGTLAEIMFKLLEQQQKDRNSTPGSFPFRLALVNVTEAYRTMLARAAAHPDSSLRARVVAAVEGSSDE